MVNSQNNYWLVLCPQGVSTVKKTKHPVHIMVFEAVTSEDDNTLPYIQPHGLRLNTEAYIKCLDKILLSESRGWVLEVPTYATKAREELTVDCKKVSTTKPLLKFGHLTSQTSFFLITKCCRSHCSNVQNKQE